MAAVGAIPAAVVGDQTCDLDPGRLRFEESRAHVVDDEIDELRAWSGLAVNADPARVGRCARLRRPTNRTRVGYLEVPVPGMPALQEQAVPRRLGPALPSRSRLWRVRWVLAGR